MKLWSRILGAIALALTLFLAVNWPYNRKHAVAAAKDQAAFLNLAADWVNAARLERLNERQHLRNDELRLEGAQIEAETAALRGVGIAQAQLEVAKARALVQSDQMLVDFGNMSDPESDSRAEESRVRAEAANVSRAVYANGWSRDEHLAYVAGVLWLCFGFAVALQKR